MSYVSTVIPGISCTAQEQYQETETYQDEVIIKPGGLFRKAITEMQIKTRTVTKTRTVERRLDALRDDIYDAFDKLIISIDFCKIPAGQFMMGEKGSQRQVTIDKDFYLGKYPVTQAQWQAVRGNNPSHFKGAPNLPVESVSWNDCQEFCKKLNQQAGHELYRMPTEAEWEYACRASTTSPFAFSETITPAFVNFSGNKRRETLPVGSLKLANAFGLFDMHGNVWEWCQDWYGEYSSDPIANPRGPSTGKSRVVRGGSWVDDSNSCRSAIRSGISPVTRSIYVGFRVAVSTPTP